MKRENLNKIISTLLILAGAISVGWWISSNPTSDFIIHNPGMDNKPPGDMKAAAVNFGGYKMKFDASSSAIPGEWNCFRGNYRDNIYREKIKLADKWGADGPPILWSIDLGEGHSGPIVSDGKVFILDYDENRRADVLRCFNFETGEELWRIGYDIYLKRNHGISRTVPAIKDDKVITIGPNCQIMCVDANNGEVNWGVDLARDFGTIIPLWYTGQCPLIYEDLIIVGVGGNSIISAFNINTGEVVWEIPNDNKLEMSHASVIQFEFNNETIFLYAAIGGIVAVNKDGKKLFESTAFNHNVVAPTPVYLGNGKLFFTAGYGAGSMTGEIKLVNGKYSFETNQVIKPNQGLASEQQTPIYYKGNLYSIQPKDAGSLRNQFVCFNPSDITKLKWSSGKTKRYGLGPYLIADNKFYILSDEGELTMLDAESNNFVELGAHKILNGHDAWGLMALVAGRLLARDSKKMVCVDLR